MTFGVNAKTFCLSFTGILEIVFTIAIPAFDILFIGCVTNTKIVYKTAEKLTFKAFYWLQMLQDATRRWRSSKATKRTLTHRWKTFKCCTMLLEDEGDETRPRGCKYPTPPCALAKILPETTVRASFVKSRTLCPLQTHFLLFQHIFFVLICIHPGTATVPPRVLASGPNHCGGNKIPDWYNCASLGELEAATKTQAKRKCFHSILCCCFFNFTKTNREKKSSISTYIMPTTVQDWSCMGLLCLWNSLTIFFDFPTSNL